MTAPDRQDARARRRAAAPRDATYFEDSQRPLASLLFLAPFVILYEIGSVLWLADEGGRIVETVAAQRMLARFFELFGAFGLYLPGLALVTVLLIQHLLSKQRWRVRPSTLAGMLAESILLTLPLVVLGLLLAPVAAAAVTGPGAAAAGVSLTDWPWGARLTISVGAGLYEELLFRMVLITAVHFVAVDLLRSSEGVGRWAGILVSAVAFAVYHDLAGPTGELDLHRLAFFFGAGVYFGMLFLWRGFGIVVGVHMLYDAVVLLALVRG